MPLDNSLLIGRQTNKDMFEDQEEVNQESLWFHDQRELLDKIQDRYATKYDIQFMMQNVDDSGGVYWSAVLKELINAFNLNTLKFFLEDELNHQRIEEVKELLWFIKGELAYHMMVDRLPETREDILAYMKKKKAPGYMVFAIDTIDREDLERFKQHWSWHRVK